jgi:hypothetical protein
MNKFDSRRAIHKTILIVAASLALATVTVTTGTSAFARGGGGFGGHFGGGFRDHFGGRFGDHFGAGRFAGRHFGRRFGDGFELYGFGDVAPYYGGYGGPYGNSGGGNTTVVAIPQANSQAANVTGSVDPAPCHWHDETFTVPSSAGGTRPITVTTCQ